LARMSSALGAICPPPVWSTDPIDPGEQFATATTGWSTDRLGQRRLEPLEDDEVALLLHDPPRLVEESQRLLYASLRRLDLRRGPERGDAEVGELDARGQAQRLPHQPLGVRDLAALREHATEG